MGFSPTLIGPDRKNEHQHNAEKRPHLLVGPDWFEPALKNLHPEQKGQAAGNHEDHRDRIDQRAVKIGQRRVLGGKPAGGDSCHGVKQRVGQAHSGDEIGKRAQHGQGNVDHAHGAGDLCDTGQDRISGIKCFCLEYLHAANLQHRQNGDRHDNDPKPTEPLQDGPPEQNARRRRLQMGNHCRAGGRQT